MLRRLMALLLLLPAAALAQAVRGTILDPATGAHLAVVDIRVLDRAGRLLFSSLSDPNGEFELPIPAGDGVRLGFERIGYLPVTSKLLFVGRAEVLDLEVHLSASAVPLQPITAVAMRPADQRLVEFYQRAGLNKRRGLGTIWTRADLDRYPQMRISHLLRTVSSRGSCTHREVYVDRMPLSITPDTSLAALLHPTQERVQELAGVTTPPSPMKPDESTDLVDWLVSPEEVEGIEIYRDTEIPPQFNPDGELCQVTLIWRKSYGHGVSAGEYRMARTALVVVALGAALGWLFSTVR